MWLNKKSVKYFLILLIIIFKVKTFKSDFLNDYQAIETNLLNKIFTNYSKTVQPLKEIDGKCIVLLKKIVNLEEKNQIMTSSVIVAVYWDDPRLSWNPEEFDGLTRIKVPAKKIWSPDLTVLNSADSDNYLKISDSNLALINSTGKVYLAISAVNLKTRCSMNVRKFPFDTQKCSIILSSWAQSTNEIDFDADTDSISTEKYVSNPIWKLKTVTYASSSSKERFGLLYSEYKTEEVSFIIELERRPLYFMVNGIFPCMILNLITILSYFLPFTSQASISMSSLLTFSVYSVRISGDIPMQSEYLPLITLYFMFSIFYTFFSLFWFTLCNYFLVYLCMPSSMMKLGKFIETFYKKDEKNNISKISPSNKTLESEISDCKNESRPVFILASNAKDSNEAENNNNKSYNVLTVYNDKSQSCIKCALCDDCDAKHNKDEKKKKTKENTEDSIRALNYLVCFLLVSVMITCNLVIWFSITS